MTDPKPKDSDKYVNVLLQDDEFIKRAESDLYWDGSPTQKQYRESEEVYNQLTKWMKDNPED